MTLGASVKPGATGPRGENHSTLIAYGPVPEDFTGIPIADSRCDSLEGTGLVPALSKAGNSRQIYAPLAYPARESRAQARDIAFYPERCAVLGLALGDERIQNLDGLGGEKHPVGE